MGVCVGALVQDRRSGKGIQYSLSEHLASAFYNTIVGSVLDSINQPSHRCLVHQGTILEPDPWQPSNNTMVLAPS